MGRWKRKKQFYGNSKMKREGKQSESFDSVALGQMKLYLVKYREGCERVCFASKTTNVTTETPASLHGDGSSKSEKEVIGGISFPLLDDRVLAKPFLALPNVLTSKHRREIHKLCVDVDLFHTGVGDRSENRYIVISIHSDGFKYVTDTISPPITTTMTTYKAWICRDEQNQEEMTRTSRDSIEALIDQPGECLRDEIDVIDFPELEGKDLSSIPSPTDNDGMWVLVDTPEMMDQCVDELMKSDQTELAFDLEMYSETKQMVMTCMFQISCDNGKDYIIDVLADGVWDKVSLLRPLFADPSIVKIGHGIGAMDVSSLHRDFGIFIVNAFDTLEAAEVLKLKRRNLASVCGTYGLPDSAEYEELKENYQATDWRHRPLTKPMIRYARYDVRFLRPLRRLMIRDLVKADLWENHRSKQETKIIAQTLQATLEKIRNEEGDTDEVHEEDDDIFQSSRTLVSQESNVTPFYTPTEESIEAKAKISADELRMQPDLMKVISQSQEKCLQFWKVRGESLVRNKDYTSLLRRSKDGEIEYTESHAGLLSNLITWRDGVAMSEQCLPGMICSLDLLVTISSKRPTCESTLRRIQYFLPRPLENRGKNYLKDLLAIVHASFEQDGAAVASPMPRNYEDPAERQARRQQQQRTRLLWVLAASAGVAAAAIFLIRRRRS